MAGRKRKFKLRSKKRSRKSRSRKSRRGGQLFSLGTIVSGAADVLGAMTKDPGPTWKRHVQRLKTDPAYRAQMQKVQDELKAYNEWMDDM